MKRIWIYLIALLFAAQVYVMAGDLDEVKAEHNAGKRSELAIQYADHALDQARTYYKTGDTVHGEAELDSVASLADECFRSVQEANKSKYWKKTEMKIGMLTRRVRSLAEDLGYDQREKASQLADHLSEIRDKLLQGVMSK
jgi:hypothetical protein